VGRARSTHRTTARVRQDHQFLPRLRQFLKALLRAREGDDAIVHHAELIEDESVVPVGDALKARNQAGRRRRHARDGCPGGARTEHERRRRPPGYTEREAQSGVQRSEEEQQMPGESRPHALPQLQFTCLRSWHELERHELESALT